MSVTKEEYVQWRNHPCSEEFLKDVSELMDTKIASLVNNAGLEPLTDRKLVGYIDALKLLADWQPTIEDEPDAT